MLGHIAVSSDGAIWIWTPEHSGVYFTRNRGTTWIVSQGVPPGTRIVADRLNAQKFYGLELFSGKLYLSRDGGATFSTRELVLPGGLPKGSRESGERGDARGGQDQIYCTPGRGGDLWLATFDGLFRSIDEGNASSAR